MKILEQIKFDINTQVEKQYLEYQDDLFHLYQKQEICSTMGRVKCRFRAFSFWEALGICVC